MHVNIFEMGTKSTKSIGKDYAYTFLDDKKMTDIEINISNIHLNYSSIDELMTIPGLTLAVAKRLISGRYYVSWDEVMSARGITPILGSTLRMMCTINLPPPADLCPPGCHPSHVWRESRSGGFCSACAIRSCDAGAYNQCVRFT